MVSTVRPKAKETPRKPMPRFGKAAASTAAPQPPNTSQNVPKNSATARRDISGCMVMPLCLCGYFIDRTDRTPSLLHYDEPARSSLAPCPRARIGGCATCNPPCAIGRGGCTRFCRVHRLADKFNILSPKSWVTKEALPAQRVGGAARVGAGFLDAALRVGANRADRAGQPDP